MWNVFFKLNSGLSPYEWDQENKIKQELNFDTDCLGLLIFLVLFNNVVTFFRESNRTKY